MGPKVAKWREARNGQPPKALQALVPFKSEPQPERRASSCVSRPIGTSAGQHGFIRLAIEVGDPRQLRQSLGLSAETPFRLIKEMLSWLSKQQGATVSEVKSRASELRLQDWLVAGANINTVATALQQLVFSGLLPAALALL